VLAYAIRRVLVSVPVLAGPRLRNPPPPRQTILNEAHRLGLDRSWPAQYGHWLFDLLRHGSFGPSVDPGNDIGDEIGSHLLVTVRLVGASVVIALVLAVVTGVVSAVRQYSVLDYLTTFSGFMFLSMPVFWFAVLLKSWGIWYNENVSAGTFYTIGDRSVLLTRDTRWGHFTDVAGHLILPTIVLSLAGYAGWTRFTRASMLEVLGSDHLRLARAKGLRSHQVLIRHALRNALTVILFNLVADLLYGVLDPRIRHA
jgi:peptide/nickel transport system permease protein